MKKLLVFIGLFVFLISNAQDNDVWVVKSNGKLDTIAYNKATRYNWLGSYVTANITIWNTEADDGAFYIGGFDNAVTNNAKKQDWNYYSAAGSLDISPIVADTSGTVFVPNYDSTRYSVKLSIPDFAFPNPAFLYNKNNTDSAQYLVVFKATKVR